MASQTRTQMEKNAHKGDIGKNETLFCSHSKSVVNAPIDLHCFNAVQLASRVQDQILNLHYKRFAKQPKFC